MFAKNPVDFPGELEGEKLCDALRLAIIAELDAISFYMQLAEKVKDPLAKKVFVDVANEEKEHVGEFLYLLRKCDPSITEMMGKGEEEVKELEEQ